MAKALDVKGLSFGYVKKHEVIKNLSLSVELGKITGLIGPNGSGKSTLIRLAGDLLKPRTGKIDVCGAASTTNEAKNKSIILASNDYLPEFLTGLEYLHFIHRMYGMRCDTHDAKRFFRRYQMDYRWNDLIEDYSHGMRKKVQLIAALMVSRPLTMIDETPNGIDIEALYNFERDIRNMARKNCGVLLCTHNFAVLENIADHIILMSHGEILVREECRTLLLEYGSIDDFVKAQISQEPCEKIE
ncbi:MAG: ABC transporter ATP-binding protein [Actinomycetaceae bacterium]|nr:ABC transporter ATP-binding protein [Actinomycetaceae bacterium]